MNAANGAALVLCFLRAAGVMAAVPFNEMILSHSNRLVIASVLVLVTVPTLGAVDRVTTVAVVAELVTGFLIGLPAGLVVCAASMFGELFDSGRGQSIGNFYEPGGGAHESTTAALCRYFIWSCLLVSGGAEVIMAGFVSSYGRIPAGKLFEAAFTRIGMDVFRGVTQAVSGTVLLFVPFAMLFVLVDFSFGLLGKMIPKASLSNESFAVKTALGLLALGALCQTGAESTLAGLCVIKF